MIYVTNYSILAHVLNHPQTHTHSLLQEKMLHFWFNTFFIDMHVAQQQSWQAEDHRLDITYIMFRYQQILSIHLHTLSLFDLVHVCMYCIYISRERDMKLESNQSNPQSRGHRSTREPLRGTQSLLLTHSHTHTHTHTIL